MPTPFHAAPNRHAAHAVWRRPGVPLIRWALLWFALSIGAAIASPMVHPVSMELVCSASGSVKAIVHTDDGAHELGSGHLDCPLCVLGGAPPAAPAVSLPAVVPVVHAASAIAKTRIATITAAPPPARGPPSLS
ncbi:hypothetical protein GNX71_29265 [Variovorax sp. RKNM96]|uniref:DUF2946 family protein n=1 Tax=Variovorax sp. RKNM96 TaxID=2681552 RepID=UPI00197D401F|nr:DUF2946 family protein [Variovorax sp. RKNM96]QSI33435.1 hypothetical protein GNX71_29265 [Variovorax sp. RKNM96]